MSGFETFFGALAAIGGLGGGASLVQMLLTRRKFAAEAKKLGVEADDLISGRALEMYDRAMKAADNAEKKVQACRDELDALRDHVDHLERIMRDAGLTPPPFRWPLLHLGGGRS